MNGKKFLRITCAQHLLEYLLVIALATAAAIAMYTYVLRAVQSGIKSIENEAFKKP